MANGKVEITVKQLQGGIKRLANSFKTLEDSLSPVAGSSQQLSNAFKELNKALGEIKSFSNELSTTIDSITSKSGKTNAKPTLFDSFTNIIDSINKSVDESKMSKFQANAKSIRSFVLSLKDMSVLKDKVADVNTLLTNLQKPVTVGGKDSAINSLVDIINTLGGISERTQQNVTGKNGVTNIKNIINPKIQGIKDIIKVISEISPSLTSLVNDKINTARSNLNAVEYPIRSFITNLSGIVDRVSSEVTTTNNQTGTTTKRTVSLVNNKIQGIRDIAKTIGIVSTELKEVSDGSVSASEKLKNIYPNIKEFVEQLGALVERSFNDTTDKNGNNKRVSVLNSRVQGLRDIARTIKILSGSLDTINVDLTNAINNITNVRTPLSNLIIEMDNLGVDKTTTKGGVPNAKFISVLNNRLQGLRDIARTIKVLSAGLDTINADLTNAINNITNIKEPLEKLITEVGNLGIRSTIQKGTGSSAKDVSVLNKNVQGIRDIAKALNILGKDLKDFSNIKSIIQQLKGVGTDIVSFIREFSPSDVDASANLKTGIDNSKAISTILKRYAQIVVDLNSIKNIGGVATEFKKFIGKVSEAVSSTKLSNIDVENAKRLSLVASAFKNIFSTMKGLNGASFSNFITNIDDVYVKLEKFINKMADLAKLPSFTDFERVSKALSNLKGRFNDATSAMNNSSRAMTQFMANVRQLWTALIGVSFIQSVVRAVKSAIKEMFNLEYAMARVNTIARVDNETLKEMTHTVQALSATYGVESAKVSKALYDINSATIKGAASMKILEQSMALAVAGFTDVEKVSDLIAKAVNAYEYNVSEASKISDILFVTVERGINPMEELSEYFGRLFTVSANAGVKLEEIAAGLSTLTARGYQTNVASTALNSAILKLSTGTKELNKLFQEYGYASSASALRTMGLSGALQVLYEATGGATNKLHDLGFNYRDIRAATTLASGAIKEYTKTLDLMNDETYKNGLTSEALAKVQDTVKFKFDQLKASITVMIQTISEYIDKNKLLGEILEYVSEGFKNVTDAMRGIELSGLDKLNAGLVMLVPKILATYFSFKMFRPLFTHFSGELKNIRLALIGNHKAATAFTLGLKKGIGGILTSSAEMYEAFVIIQGLLENIARLFEVFKAGTFWSGFADLTGFDSVFKVLEGDFLGALENYGRTLVANIAGISGSLVDALSGFTLTDFGSQWRNAIKPADYKESDYNNSQYQRLIEIAQPNMNKSFEELSSILKSSALNENIQNDILDKFLHNIALNKVSKEINTATKQLKEFRYSEENYSEDKIQELYEKVRKPIVEYAESLGLSSDEIKSLTKRIDDARDGVESLNKEFKELQPNMQALNDVFEESRKRISDSFEKFAGPIQKLSQKIGIAEEGISVLSKNLGISTEEVEAYFSNPVNFEEFEKKLREGIAFYADGINDKLADVISKASIKIDADLDFDTVATNKLKEFFEKSNAGTNTIIKDLYGTSKDLSVDELVEAVKSLDYSSEIIDAFKHIESKLGDKSGLIGFTELIDAIKSGDIVSNTKKERIESGFTTISDALLNSGVLDEEKTKLFNKQKDSLRKIFEARYAEFENNPEVFVDIIADGLNIVDKETRKAMQDVSGSFQEAKKASVDFTKQMVSFGSTVNKLASQKYSIKDILENSLKLPEVEFFKKQIQQNLRISDFDLLEPYLEVLVADMKSGKSRAKITKNFADELRRQRVIDPVMKDVDAVAIANATLDPIINMFKLTDEFNKKFKEIDFIKFINELDYGTEISGFEKYRKVGKGMIEALKSEMIETKQGAIAFEKLFSEFRRDLESGMSFKDAQKAFATNYGADAFNVFYENFKEYQNLIKEFVTKVSEADFTKLLNKMQFGGEMSAFKQYRMIDRDKIAGILQRRLTDASDLIFEDAFNELARNTKTLGYTGARLKFKNEYGEEALNQLDNLTKEYESVWSGSSYSLMQSNKNIKKKIHNFLKNFADAFLTPIQQFDKTEAILKKQLAKVKQQAKEGVVNPELVERTLENIQKLQNLNEEAMTMKVPASITASEAVKTGSKEAFDLVATNIFRDMYKTNVQQTKLQKTLVDEAKTLTTYLTNSNNTLRVISYGQ